MADIQTIAQTKFEVTASLPATFTSDDLTGTATAIAAITDFTEIGLASNVAGHGDTYSEVTYNVITERRTRKAKGVVDGGTETFTFAREISDAGQIVLNAAKVSDNNYFFKETWQDGTIEYYLGKVSSFAGSGGGTDTVREATCNVMIDSETIDSVQLTP